jgi:hypothetical protein
LGIQHLANSGRFFKITRCVTDQSLFTIVHFCVRREPATDYFIATAARVSFVHSANSSTLTVSQQLFTVQKYELEPANFRLELANHQISNRDSPHHRLSIPVPDGTFVD